MSRRGLPRRGRPFHCSNSSWSDEERPKGLKGKQIGLWYAERSKRRREAQQAAGGSSETREEKPLGRIMISESKRQNITKLLNVTPSLYPSSFVKKTNTYEHLEETDFKHEFLTHITGSIIQKLQSGTVTSYDYNNDVQNQDFFKDLETKADNKTYKQMQEVRKRLPSMGMKEDILNLINKHQIIVISGETGCGKTTQVAQFILDDFIKKGKGSQCKIVCTQPRRISAISVAERVASERNESLGRSVGFQIRLEKTLPRDRGSILFCTTGVLLKFMESNPSLNDISHLVLDEIHERDVVSDFLLTVLKDVTVYRPDLKIILMSATLNSEAFSKYYNNAPHINIPGFTYPVTEYFLEDVLQMTQFKFQEKRGWRERGWKNEAKQKEWSDYVEPYIRQLESEKKYDRHVTLELRKPESQNLNLDLIFNLLLHICRQNNDDGAILIFVPGFTDISAICKRLRESGRFNPNRYIVIPLHSQLSTVEQKKIFRPTPKGVRKIIVATNIAETSITIDDVTTVIDSGFIKISNLDADSGIETLNVELVSQANALQRKGRAGRVKSGVCYHLISKIQYELLDKFLKPEVLRKRLEDVILSLKMLQLGNAEEFLAKLMDPPESKSVQQSVALLQRLGALDENEVLTPLGFHMAKLPVPAQCSKMLILAAWFNCLDPILSVAASLGYKDAYQLSIPTDRNAPSADKMRHELSRYTNSDHICMHYAIRGFEEADNQYSFCRKYFLNSTTLRLLLDMRKQFALHLFEMKFISEPDPCHPTNNRNSKNLGLIKAIISAGLYPNVAILTKNIRGRKVMLRSVSGEKMNMHPKSVLMHTECFPSPLVMYHIRQKSTSLYIHDGTVVFPLSLVFFGDQFRIHKGGERAFTGVSINKNMRFLCSESTSMAIQQLRNRLNQILEWKVSHPGHIDWNADNSEVNILRVIMDLIASEDSEELDLSDYDDV